MISLLTTRIHTEAWRMDGCQPSVLVMVNFAFEILWYSVSLVVEISMLSGAPNQMIQNNLPSVI